MDSKDHTVLVTGASGFIGANLCRRLLDMGLPVHAFTRPASDTWRIDAIRDQLHIHTVDITDADAVRDAVNEIRPTIIYHLATHGAYPFQTDPEAILLTNVFGLWNVLNACNEVGYELFVNTGSSSEYGTKLSAMRESDLLEPNSYYAVAKAGQSLLCQHMSRIHDRPIVTFRLFSVFGPFEEATRLLPKLMHAAISDAPIDMVSPQTCRDFVYIDDIIDAYLMIDELKAFRGEVFNLGTGVQTPLKELVDLTGEINNRPVRANWGQMAARMWDANVWVADVSKIRRLTGWRPKVSLRQGLAKCLAWFAENADIYTDRYAGRK